MSTAASQPELVTREGYERLHAELDRLVRVRRPQLAGELRAARADGAAPGEDGRLADALSAQAELERRVDELRATLARVQIAAPAPDGVADIGQRLRIRLGLGAEPRACRLVGALEADAAAGEISVGSPIGAALVGRRAGDAVEVETPGGTRVVELLSVEGP